MTDPVGSIYATFTDPAGELWELSNTSEDVGWFTTFAIAGWGARPYDFTLDPLPRGGDSVRHIRAESARVIWPLYIYGDTHMQWLARYRALKRAFLMTVHRQQAGVLRVARPDGSAREIDVYYEDGFGGKAGEEWVNSSPVLTLLAPDGYWRDIEALTVENTHIGTTVPYLNPFPTVSSSQVLGETQIENPGEVAAWPDWTITGPMTSVIATNNTTGHSFTLTHTLTSGQQITITTLQPAVRGPGDINLVGALNWPEAYLWPLAPGVNDIEYLVAGASTGTKIALTFHARYEGA